MKVENRELKRTILDVSFKHGLSHLSSCLTAVDIIARIYEQKKDSEPFVLSNGHSGLALYSVLQHKYRSPTAEEIFNHHGVHPDRCGDCRLDCSSGSLGQGLPIALGMALADRTQNVYCLISDGEAAEGSIWEALRIKREFGVNNLRVYCNMNGFGAYRKIEQHLLSCQLKMFDPKIEIMDTEYNKLPNFLLGQQGHYRVMSEEDYRKGLDWLNG